MFTWLAVHSVAIEAVFMIGDVADSIVAIAPVVVLVAAILNALLAVTIAIKVSSVTNKVVDGAVLIISTAAQVIPAAVPADRVAFGAVWVPGASWNRQSKAGI